MNYFNTFLPSYTPSIDCFGTNGLGIDEHRRELSKSVYSIYTDDSSSTTVPATAAAAAARIKNIHVYLKLQFVEANIKLQTCVSFDGKHELTGEEWNETFAEKVDFIRDFFRNPNNSSSPLLITSDRLSVHVTSLASTRLLLLHSNEQEEISHPVVINHFEWSNIDRVIDCVNARIKHLDKIKSTYENRLNFFKKNFKIQRPTTLQEAHHILNGLCNMNDIVDCEIKCYATDLLYNIYFLF